MSIKNKVINDILDREGPYSNDPSDSGGETTWGITESAARTNGYKGAMRDLPRSLAFSIMEDRYWSPLKLDIVENLSPKIAEELADSAVNVGVSKAGSWLQTALNALNDNGSAYPDMPEDGLVGSATIAALKAYLRHRGKDGETVILRALNGLQTAHYLNLSRKRPKDERFVFGWLLNRVS